VGRGYVGDGSDECQNDGFDDMMDRNDEVGRREGGWEGGREREREHLVPPTRRCGARWRGIVLLEA